jgi:hypothetical protein
VIVCSTKVLAAPSTVWKIKYSSGPFTGGATTVYLAPDAIKIKTISNYEVYAKAPDWNATVYSGKAHAMCTVPYSSYSKGRFFVENEATDNELAPSKAISTEAIRIFGLPAQRQSWRTVSIDVNYYRIRTKPEKVITQLSTTTRIPHNKMQIALLAAWIPIPHLKAVPLVFVNKQRNGRIQDRWSAITIEQLKASQFDFHPPTGYKKVAKASELLTAQYSKVIEGLLGEENDREKKRSSNPSH